MNRREFVVAGSSGIAAMSLLAQFGCRPDVASHPWMYVTREEVSGLRSLNSLRVQLPLGHTRVLWERILNQARADLERAPILPTAELPDRSPASIQTGNADYVVCKEAGQRILRHAIVHALVGESGHLEAAVRQIATILNRELWPLWLDNAHIRFGHPAGLRTGMLARDVGLAYDWLYESLSLAERELIVDGLDERAIQPFFISVEQDAWWLHDLNNWLTTIVGGVGIAAMALGDAHKDSARLVDYAVPKIEEYLGIYGESGEFNESVAYANATERPVGFFSGLRYSTRGGQDRIASDLFRDAGRWMQYMTLPPGRVVAFGDSHADAKPWVRHFAAIAAATRDNMLQWYYLEHSAGDSDALELLWYDPTLAPVNPQGSLPLGRAFRDHGACFSSRTSWDPDNTHCVVYGKASREENHEHNDDGQICIDGFGERLIIDPGSPPSYPADFFEAERWEYYNASVAGHNVIRIDGKEMRTRSRERGEAFAESVKSPHGRLVDSEFDDSRGGRWQADLSAAYGDKHKVVRNAVHALPGVVVVVDDVDLDSALPISLRWHTATPVEPGRGAFSVIGDRAQCVCLVSASPGVDVSLTRRQHEYQSPFDKNRLGEPLEQRNESYIDVECEAESVRMVSLFLVERVGFDSGGWQMIAPDQWVTRSSVGVAHVQIESNLLTVSLDETVVWNVDLALKG